MTYNRSNISETAAILSVAFVVGVIAQYLRQRTDETVSNKNIYWFSVASGFSAMITVGLLTEYTDISPAFLIAISGTTGWAGISILGTLSKLTDQMILKGAEKKLDIKIERPPEKEEGEDANDPRITGVDSQLE